MNRDFLTFAHQLADAAGAVIRPYFGAHGEVEAKGDASPVTVADRAAEAAMRELITQYFPEHGIYGEEFGIEVSVVRGKQAEPAMSRDSARHGEDSSPSRAQIKNYTWVLDPIDGTRAFIAGRKEWGTLIALCADGVPILGILDQPVTGERWVGVRGAPTLYIPSPIGGGLGWGHKDTNAVPHNAPLPTSPLRGEEIRTRPCAQLADAEFSTTSVNYFTPVQAAAVVKLAQSCRSTVRDGDCYAYGLLARGMRDIVVDAGVKPYDVLALVPIVEGAGGVMTGWDGAPVTLTHFNTALATGSSTLHAHALKSLGYTD